MDKNFGNWYWIGVKGNKYASDGSRILINPPWVPNYDKGIDKCLQYCDYGRVGQWCNLNCRQGRYNSVCERV